MPSDDIERFYGSSLDGGNPPGYHVDIVPKAPMAPKTRTKITGKWAALKSEK